AQQRDEVFLADFFPDPVAHQIFVDQVGFFVQVVVQLEPLGLFAEGLGVVQVQRRVGVVRLQKPLFQRLRVVLFLQAGPVGVVFVGDLVVFGVDINILG